MRARSYVGPRTRVDVTQPPFSRSVRVGDTLYLSADIGLTSEGLVPDGVARTMRDAGLTMDDIVFVQVFYSDLSHFGAWNNVYRTRFEQEFPARAFIGSGPLLFGAGFEIQPIGVAR